jgi:hypothetical protein
MRLSKENDSLIGAESGLLKVVADAEKHGERGEHLWLCQCSCGNPELVEVDTHSIIRKHKKSCGCLLLRRKKYADHNNRECREMVLLALYWATQWGCDLRVYYRIRRRGNKDVLYTVTSEKGRHPHLQLGYIVTPKGQVSHYPGYPDYATLLGLAIERIYLQFRRREETSCEWITYGDNFEVFWAHQRDLAEERVRELNETNPSFEHRIKED